MNFGDGIDKTAQSVIWNLGDSQGKSAQGEIVPAPESQVVENTLRGEILDLLQGDGLDFLKNVLRERVFVENVELPEETPVEDEEETPEP